MGVPPSRPLADLLGASVGVWGIWNLLRKQHRLRGVARVFRWAVVALGVGAFEVALRGGPGHRSGAEFWGLVPACLFFAFPDISFYLVIGCQRLTGWPRGPQSRNATEIKAA